MVVDGSSSVDWSKQVDEGTKNHALMAYSSGSESEVCFNYKCKYDLDMYKTECEEQKAKIRNYEVESIAYENALKSRKTAS